MRVSDVCKKQGDAGIALVSRGRQHACVEALSVGSRVRKNSEIKAMAAKHGRRGKLRGPASVQGRRGA